jgi:hypothetical protein
VVTLGNLSACGIGAHSDGKNGLVCANTPRFWSWMYLSYLMLSHSPCWCSSCITPQTSSSIRGSVDPQQNLNFQLASTFDEGSRTDKLDYIEGTLVHPFQRCAGSTVLEEMDPKCMAVSSRRTYAFQKTGLSAIRGLVSSGQMKEPVFHGYSQHYKNICCWGANDPKQHCGGHGCVTNTSTTPPLVFFQRTVKKMQSYCLMCSVMLLLPGAVKVK